MERMKKYLISFILFVFSFSIIFYVFKDYQTAKKKFHPDYHQEVWMTIFVHGTFSPVLGLLSAKNVFADNLKGTAYRSVSKKMRNDDFFFQDQPILARGLHKVIPTFSINSQTTKRLAAYPIIKAFEEIYQTIPNAPTTINHFYTFGWSGLMSQNKRRLDALRFFNCLAEELTQLQLIHKKTPKVRIVAHSHGGNLCLNLAAINQLLENELTLTSATSKDQFESLEKMLTIITSLPAKDKAKKRSGVPHFDYKPEKALTPIDELVLYATPLQPETEPFFASSFFTTIYHFYAQNDLVQQLDGISTKENHSKSRLSQHLLTTSNKTHKIIQCRIMYNQDLDKANVTNNAQSLHKSQSMWTKVLERVFSNRDGAALSSKDPSHKEFWYFAWRNEKTTSANELSPLPLVSLTGMFTHLLSTLSNVNDVDIDVALKKTEVEFTVVKHDSNEILKTGSINTSIINQLKQQIIPWKPVDFSERSAFNTIYKLFIKNTLLN